MFVIGVGTGTHGMTFPCFKWASALPFALFSHSIVQFNWNKKKTVGCAGSLVPFLFLAVN